MNYKVKPFQLQSGVTEYLMLVQEYCILWPQQFFIFFPNGKWMFFHRADGTQPSCRDAGDTQEVLNTTILLLCSEHTLCLLPCSDSRWDLHSSVLAGFTSISGWEREGSLWQVDFELLPQPGLTLSSWADLYSSSVSGSRFIIQCGLKWLCLHLEVSTHPSMHSESLCWPLKVLLAGVFAMRLLYPVHTYFSKLLN